MYLHASYAQVASSCNTSAEITYSSIYINLYCVVLNETVSAANLKQYRIIVEFEFEFEFRVRDGDT